MTIHPSISTTLMFVGLSLGHCLTIGGENIESGDYWLGLACREPTAAVRAQTGLNGEDGLLVYAVAPQGPGHQGGVELYDIVLSVNGKPVGRNTSLSDAWDHSSKQPVRIELIRQGKTTEVNIQPSPRPVESRRSTANSLADTAASTSGPSNEPPRHGLEHPTLQRIAGLELAPISEEASKKLPSPYTGGVAVVNVERDKLAGLAGIKPGDIIVALDNWRIRDMNDVGYVLKNKGFNRFFLVRLTETGSTTLYGQLEAAIGAVGGAGPKIALENQIAGLAQDRRRLLGFNAEIELSMLETKLALIAMPANDEERERVESQRRRATSKYATLEEKKKLFDQELLVVEAKLALAKRLLSGWPDEK